MEWLEATPLPIECQGCNKADCYNCDFAAGRWILSEVDQLKIRRKVMVQSIMRLQQKLDEVDCKLAQLENNINEANGPMTLDHWVECVDVSYKKGDSLQLRKLCDEYPQFIRAMHEKYKLEMEDPDSEFRKQKEAHWEKMKEKLAQELGEEWVALNCR